MVDEEAKPFNKCLLYILIFLMIITGSTNTIFIKILQNLKSPKEGKKFERHHFLITYCIFLGEFLSIFYYIYKVKKIKKSIKIEHKNQGDTFERNLKEEDAKKRPPFPTNLFFAITAGCDIFGSTLFIFGSSYLTGSIYQMMRALELFYVCIFSKIILKHHIYRHAILGICILIIGIILIGIVEFDKTNQINSKNPLIGIILICIGQLFYSIEFTLQEIFIKKYDVHPFQLVGFEGVWGVILYTILLIIFQFIPCNH